MTDVMFNKGEGDEVVPNGCSMAINEILKNVFPEYLKHESVSSLQKHFIQPLLEII